MLWRPERERDARSHETADKEATNDLCITAILVKPYSRLAQTGDQAANLTPHPRHRYEGYKHEEQPRPVLSLLKGLISGQLNLGLNS